MVSRFSETVMQNYSLPSLSQLFLHVLSKTKTKKPTQLLEGACASFKESKAIADFTRAMSSAKPDACEATTDQIKALKKVF